VLAEQVGVEIYADKENKNPVDIAQKAVAKAKAEGYKIVIVDTAGRLAVDAQMMDEIAAIKAAVQPQEILFVVDSMTGQDAVNTAQAFNQRLDYTGVVLSKLDGDSRGGAALSIAYTVGKPIKFIGTGEKLDAIDVFHPDRMANRILGMGDVISLVERVQQQYNEEESRKIQKKIAQNKFDFDDFLAQINQIQKMGNIKDLMGMIPGMGNAMKDVEIDNGMFKEVECIIQSMTKKERANPEIINPSRRQRIAQGAGKDISKVNQLIKQFDDMRKMMHQMNKMGFGSNRAPKRKMF
jgi:signal recognition particle subunit SRP54